MAVLNPLGRVDANIMDDADLAGPIIICFLFAMGLLFVSLLVLLHVAARLPRARVSPLVLRSVNVY